MTWRNAGSPDCCICGEISSGQFPQDYRSVYDEESRVCYETSEFVVLPTVSPLQEGHVLVLPRRHVTCLSALSQPSRQMLLECVEKISRKIATRYGSELYFFEHGTRSPGLACGIDHGHLHILPLPAGIADGAESQVEVDFPTCACDSLSALLSGASRPTMEAYILHGRTLGNMRISFSDEIPSQYMRRLVRGLQRRTDWDWKSLSGRAEFRSTYEALRTN